MRLSVRESAMRQKLRSLSVANTTFSVRSEVGLPVNSP